jgi:hypothetical protein
MSSFFFVRTASRDERDAECESKADYLSELVGWEALEWLL